MFDNGEDRTKAAWTFLKWFTSPTEAMKWSLATGDLPIRESQTQPPTYQQYTKKYTGIQTFVETRRTRSRRGR